MEMWLNCTITPGQFSGEYAVEGQLHNGVGFSLFASNEDLECRAFPTGADREAAFIRVQVLDQRDGLALVQLPQQTLENGNTVTVRTSQLRKGRARQEA